MSIDQRTCFVVSCDDCGTSFDSYEEQFTVHFDSEATAIKAVTGEEWAQVDDAILCPTCVCARTGHALVELHGASRYCKCGKAWERAEVAGANDERINGGKS